ncbi:MAG: hypothetical protein AAFO97_13370 [Pseudomonadota bacterium]
MRRFALIFALWAPDLAVADWVKMSGKEISEALTGRTLEYLDKDDPTQRVDTLQDFRASGKTLYTFKGRESWGNWRVENDQYCSQWPPNDLWACYGMERDGATLRFVGERDDITAAQYAD